MASNAQQISVYLTSLVEQTKAGKLVWRQINPTTFASDIAQASARLTLQRVPIPPGTYNPKSALGALANLLGGNEHIFQVQELPAGNTILTLSPGSNGPDSTLLSSMYDLAEDAAKQNAVDVLRRIVDAEGRGR